MRLLGMPAKYWIYLLVVVFGIPTLIDGWSVITFLLIASSYSLALAIAIANHLQTHYRANDVQGPAIQSALDSPVAKQGVELFNLGIACARVERFVVRERIAWIAESLSIKVTLPVTPS